MTRILKLAICITAVAGLCAMLTGDRLFGGASAQSETVDFRRDIEPIFSTYCVRCHGEKRARAELRLDSKASAMKGGVSGPAIVPGKSKESLLVKRILGEGDQAQMPFGGDPLKPEQIELIRKWIDEGAVWPESDAATGRQGGGETEIRKHWAFVAPVRPAVPEVKNKAWARTPIDNFILAELEKRGFAPSPEASKTTLIRRLSLDLTGLPPALEEVDQFLGDRSPKAYEKLVDRLLDSPHYGERWGRWWLDAARYADTNGFEKDLPRSIWPYRDWVIDAFNEDMPFDRFTIEQLAGDLLPEPSLDQRIATGFLRNSMLNQEGGVDPEQFRVEGLIDRVDAVGKAFLGLTVACAQCHNHKFDPITQKDYFKFYAFLNSDDEPSIEIPDAKVNKKRAEIRAKVAKLEEELIAATPDLEKRMAEWERQMNPPSIEWTPLTGGEIFAAFGVKFDKLEDGSFLARGDNATSNNYKVTVQTKLANITGFRVEFLTDPNLPRTGPGRAPDGSFYFTELIVEAAPLDKPEAVQPVILTNATADYSPADSPVSYVIDGNQKTHWSSEAGPLRRNNDRHLVFAAKTPAGFEGGTLLQFQLMQKRDETIITAGTQPNIGRFRLSVTTAPNPVACKIPVEARRLIEMPLDKRTAGQKAELFSIYRTTVDEWVEANSRIDDLMKDWPLGPTTMVLADRRWPRETRIFRRGDWKRPGDAVEAGTPGILHRFPEDAPRNRLGLAGWIVSKDNPLTARVIVNRIWQQYFGAGLVTTPEDFGKRCEPPSHPELLDWLAVEFIESGWSIKHIHRLIVGSAVYKQSSDFTPKLLEADPNNQWLARAPRLRVEAETVRDIALAASGLLNPELGGPPVYPPIPDGVLTLGYGRPMDWPTSTGEDRYRRAIYTFVKRSIPYPSLLVFDAPNADFSCTRRIRSNTPLQALTTLNDKMFMETAQGLALRVYKEGGATDRSKMIYAFRLCTGRHPDQFELQELLALLRKQRPNFRSNTSTAVYVAAADLSDIPKGVDLEKVAPWTMVARVLLNLDETITKE